MNYQEKYQKAKQANYTDEEIFEYLSQNDPEFTEKTQKAVNAGYSPQEILNYFSGPKQEKKEEEEGFVKSAFRTAVQLPLGVMEGTVAGLTASGMQFLGFSALDPEEIEDIRRVSEREGVPFDEEKYVELVNEGLEHFPTVANLAREIEKHTGIPLEPKEWYQKALRLGSLGYKAQPGAMSQKAVSGVAAPAVSQSLQQAGVPEFLADMLGLAAGGAAGAKTPKAEVEFTKTKPSGMVERQFEKITKPTEVSNKKINQINDKLQTDFKNISNKIIEDSPIGETANNLRNDPKFKQESRELLNQAQKIADSIPDTLPTKILKQEYSNTASKKVKGFALGEYDKNYLNYMNEAIKEIIPEKASMGEIVEQYRKNNQALSEYFEPGSSKAQNRAKRDAILDQNRSIANVIEKSNPELSKVFKEGNERWSKIMDVEAVDNFVDGVFKEGINHKKLHDFFDKSGYDRIFKRALGEQGFKEFETLVSDMLTTESPYKMLKIAKDRGYMELVNNMIGYMIHPKLGMVKTGLDALKYSYRGLMNAILDKPQLGLKFNKAVKELKEGKFAAAEKDIKEVKAEILPKEKSRIENMSKEEPKFKETLETEKNSRLSPKEQAERKFKEYGLDDFIQEAIEEGYVKNPNDFDNYINKDPYLKRKADRIVEDLGKPLAEILDDLTGRKKTPKEAKVQEPLRLEQKQTPKENPKAKPKKVVKTKTPPKQEIPAKSMTEEKVNEVKRQDISKQGLKNQKLWLLTELENAIKKAPQSKSTKLKKGAKRKDVEAYVKAHADIEYLTFDVPGDGQFKIKNHKNALETFKESVEKKWPDKPLPKLKNQPKTWNK